MGSFSRNSQTLTLSIPLGFRFEPTDAELMDYLLKKINSLPLPCEFVIHEVDVYAYHPCFLCGTFSSFLFFIYFSLMCIYNQ